MSSNKSFSELRNRLRRQIIQPSLSGFQDLALQIFQYQAQHNPIYRQYLSHLSIEVNGIQKLTDIPFMPIQFFKQHLISSGTLPGPVVTFESSGTTQQKNEDLPLVSPITSKHALYDADLYHTVAKQIFEAQYGPLENFHILALLPSYLERNNSSLVYMLDHFIQQTGSDYSGFYLHNTDEMLDRLRNLALRPDGKKVLLMGVTFALLDLAESNYDLSFLSNLQDLMIMDTGGMKGRRKELLREEVHDILTARLGVDHVHSEYGMTELLSQGYSAGDGLFTPGRTMQIILRDVNDPFTKYDQSTGTSKTGGINVIDLANVDTCSFIETQDLGRFGATANSFYVMGRFDNSDIRGCNLMVL